VEVTIPLRLRFSAVDKWHPQRVAVVRGPVVLVEEGNAHEPVFKLPETDEDLNKWFVPANQPGYFRMQPPDGTNVRAQWLPFYAAIESFDPNPAQIRSQLGDHDGINGNSDDFAGVIIDSRNDGKTALEFFANSAGTQYDASQDDASGEDSSPDFFWDSATKKTATGWILARLSMAVNALRAPCSLGARGPPVELA
jgi:hypothetical protein